MRERLQQKACGHAFEQVDDTRDANVWFKAHEQMHVVAQNLHLVDDETVFASDLAKHALANTLNLADQNLITILRAENHVKTNLPETMAHTKQIHGKDLRDGNPKAPRSEARRLGKNIKQKQRKEGKRKTELHYTQFLCELKLAVSLRICNEDKLC